MRTFVAIESSRSEVEAIIITMKPKEPIGSSSKVSPPMKKPRPPKAR